MQKLEGRVILIPNADPGFDWLFSHKIAGLITAWGGANSHMAIRAGELGLPAVVGVGEHRFANLKRHSRYLSIAPQSQCCAMKLLVVSQRIDEFAELGERRDTLDQRFTTLFQTCGYMLAPIPNLSFVNPVDDFLTHF